MTRGRPNISNGLHWVRNEIEASLTHARSGLELYLESPDDLQPLRMMAEELRQVHGTMRMIQCLGAAQLAAEMLALLDASIAQPVESPELAFTALSDAMLQLSDYIDLLVHGEDDRAVVLQPAINELRLARGQPVMTEADLFSVQAREQIGLQSSPSADVGDGGAQTVARRELAGFQSAFLQWFRGNVADQSMTRMGQIADAVAVNLSNPSLRLVWSGFAALAECLTGGLAPDSLDIKRLFGKAGSQLRALAESGEAAAAAMVGDTGWQLLYHIARTPRRTERADALVKLYGVSSILPDVAKIGELRQRLRGPNSGILDRLYHEITLDFTRIKDGIDLAVRTGGHAPAELTLTRERLQRLANTFDTLGLQAPRQALLNQMQALDDVSRPEAQQWMELATAILRVEYSLEEALFRVLGRHDGEAARSFAQIEADIPHAQDMRISRRALLRESLIEITKLKTGVDDFLKTGDQSGLVEGPQRLHTVASVLRFIDHDRAAELLLTLEHYAASGTLGGPLAQPDDYPRYADAIACVDVFLEGLREDLPQVDPILDDLQVFIGRLEVRVPVAEAPVVVLEVPQEWSLIEPAEPVLIEPAPIELESLVAAEIPVPAEPAEAVPAPASAPVSEGIDPEIREIFVEEAGEVLTELRRQLPQLLRAPDDRPLLAAIRRAFHTLKGSGRMVGALRIGEFGWSIESLLNRCLDGALAVRRPVLDVVAEAIALLPGLIDNFRGIGDEAPAVKDLLARAEDVASGRGAAETDMLAVFMDDARERLAFIGRWLESRDVGDHEFVVEPDLVRAFHTLKGSAAVVNGGAVSQLAALFEQHFNTVRFEGRTLSVDSLGVIGEGLVALRAGVESIGNGQLQDADAKALAEWRSRLEAAAETAGVPAAPPRPAVDESFSLLALDKLQSIERTARAWSGQPSLSAATALAGELDALATAASRSGARPMAELAGALVARLRPWRAGSRPEAGFFSLLLELLESLYQQLDDYREGSLAGSADVLLRAARLPQPVVPVVEEPPAFELDPELLEIFCGEAEELLEALDQTYYHLMSEPNRGPVIDDLKRTLHTLKGSARTAGAMAIGDVAHHLETRLEDAGGSAGPSLLARFEAGLDGLHGLVEQLQRGEPAQAAPVIEAIARAVPEIQLASTPTGFAPSDAPSVAPQPFSEPFPGSFPGSIIEQRPAASQQTIEPVQGFDAFTSTQTVTMQPPPPAAEAEMPLLQSFDSTAPMNPPASESGVAPMVETISVETFGADSMPAGNLHVDSLSVATEPPPLAEFDGFFESADPQPALSTAPTADPAREVYWTADPTALPLPPEMAAPSTTIPALGPLSDHPMTTRVDLPVDAVAYAGAAAPPAEPITVAPESVELTIRNIDGSLPTPAADTRVDFAPLPPVIESEPVVEWRHDAFLPETAEAEAALPLSGLDLELADIFSNEAGELLETLDAALEDWRNGDAGEPVLEIQRALHTLKGGARMAGLEVMGDVAHELESKVNRAIGSGEFPDNETFNSLRADLESLQTLHDRLRRGETAELPAVPVPAPVHGEAAPASPSQWLPGLFWRPEGASAASLQQRRETARVPVETLDAMLNEAGEISIYRSRLEEHNAGLRVQLGEMAQTVIRVREQLRMMEFETESQIAARGLSSTAESGSDRYAQDFDPLEMDRYSRMQELSRALAESITDLSSLQATMEEVVSNTDTLLLQQSRINTEVQQGLMGTLMVPFSRQVQRLSRVVRQTAGENGKQAAVQFTGAEAELDRNVLERMTAPLEHLLRNAVVHGIESPEQRARAGKAEIGQIGVNLRREGAQLLVEVSDDGAGLDFLGIRDKAVEKGLMATNASASDDDLSRFIFEPGFSTARTLTQDAGRGIGLDVVSSEVKQLGGTLELRSETGIGTRFLVRLPLTLAVSQALLVAVAGETYAVPLASVEGIARIPRRDVDDYVRAEGPLFAYGGRGYRVSHLGDYLGTSPNPQDSDGRTLTAILVRIGEGLSATSERRVALIVDNLLGNREIVSKTAGPQLSAVPGVAGATILADGRVVLILDVPALVVERSRRALMADAAGSTPELAADADTREMIMVVDDSVTMRRVAERLLTRQGYRVITAKDGLDAIAMLQTETPSTILLDIEMPRADGFEVAAFVRNTPRIATTPIIMITSRSGEKHRERARSLYVDRYLIKPYQEEQLLGEINSVRRGRSS